MKVINSWKLNQYTLFNIEGYKGDYKPCKMYDIDGVLYPCVIVYDMNGTHAIESNDDIEGKEIKCI